MNGVIDAIAQKLSETLGKTIRITSQQSVTGGCINQAIKIKDAEDHQWFVKINQASLLDMFIAEAAGLEEINDSNSIRSPKVVCCGVAETSSYLVLEYIPLNNSVNQAATGEQLALMHRHTQPQFGWDRDNTIGSTPQKNDNCDIWLDFYKEHRLQFQLELAKQKGYSHSAYDDGILLANNLTAFFEGYRPEASLLHGDLWGGNCGSDDEGNPVIFDPAVYYGDREADIAMTELFGGFSQGFYTAYQRHYVLDSGYATRKKLYNLYHILNHFNLFGGGYASQASSMTRQLLAEIR